MTTPLLPPTSLPAHLTWRIECAPQIPEGEGPKPTPVKRSSESTETSTGTGTPEGPKKPVRQPGFSDMCGGQQMLLFLVMGAAFWFLLIRPQMKQEKATKQLQASLQKGDPVITNSGIHGIITRMDEKTVTIKTDEQGHTQITFDRAAINRSAKTASDDSAGKASEAPKS